VLAFGTQVRGFKPGRSRRNFKGEKILSTPSFEGEVKPSVPCRRFAACKRSLELRGSRIVDEICRNISRPRRVPPSASLDFCIDNKLQKSLLLARHVLGITPVSSVSNGLYFLTLPPVSAMRVIYTSKGMSKKFRVSVINYVRVIYRKIRYYK
jgi:hypothetical protein